MVRILGRFANRGLICGLALALFVPLAGACAKGFRVLYTFTGGNDGGVPSGELIADKAGNLYGTTALGGAHENGTVFKLAPDGSETVLHSFGAEKKDGARPYGQLLMDKAGNLYGTTLYGSGNACSCGAVFRLAADGTETVLYAFTGGSDGFAPAAGLIGDRAGNLYGTTSQGGDLDGDSGCFFIDGCGTVFELAPDGTKTTLYEFHGPDVGSDGSTPYAGVIADGAGNLYGTTYAGGANIVGTVFRIAPDGTEKLVYTFTGSDGFFPYAGLIADGSDNLYGTASMGGANNDGVVFRLAPDGSETVLYSFAGEEQHDGAFPYGGLTMDRSGNLYGTTYGGGRGCHAAHGCGTVFKLTADGTEKVLHSFREKSDGAGPSAGLTADNAGNLYGVASSGGAHGYGTVFTLRK